MNDSATLPEPAMTANAPRVLATGRILLAEDDTEMRRLLAATLRKDHYVVIEATDGRELLEALAGSDTGSNAFDLVITDVRMPRLSGLQALKLIRACAWRVPVVIITAFGDRATHIEALLLGAEAVLDKPFEIEDLSDLVRRLLPPERAH